MHLSMLQPLQELPKEFTINSDHVSEKKALTVLYVKLKASFVVGLQDKAYLMTLKKSDHGGRIIELFRFKRTSKIIESNH